MMHYKPKLGYILAEDSYKVDRFRNEETLNIFCDGSYYGVLNHNKCVGGYAAVGVVGERVIQVCRRGWKQQDKFANDLMELHALREAISMAFMYQHQYANINIFSDSNYAVNVVKTWIYKWSFNNDNRLYLKGKKIPANINIVYEIAIGLIRLMSLIPNLNLMYTKGHINSMGNIQALAAAKDTFCRENGINENIDLNLIRYLSRYNDVADKQAKIAAHDVSFDYNMSDAIEFMLSDVNQVAHDTIQANIIYT